MPGGPMALDNAVGHAPTVKLDGNGKSLVSRCIMRVAIVSAPVLWPHLNVVLSTAKAR